ncbi:MAG: hypothetical protein GY757_39490, partial [bacterium]|nr:hypothetical protein [bacterium]
MKKNKTQKKEMAPVPGLSPLVEKILSTPGEKKLHLEFLHFLKALDTRRYPYFNIYQADFCLVLAIIFKAGTVNHQALAPIAARQLTAKYRLQEDEGLSGRQELWPLFADDIVFLSYLEKTINRNYDMETFLVRLRRSLLLDYQSSTAMSPENLSLAAAVAHQCFNNEYIFHE